MRDYLSANHKSWSWATDAQNRLKGDYVAAIESGIDVLPQDVTDALRPKPGQRLLHLFCNDGRELCFICRKFNVSGTGVDFASPAVRFASDLSNRLHVDARFECAEVQLWLGRHQQEFDVAFTTLGSLWWIDDLARWLAGVRAVLPLCGRLVIWDFHPMALSFDDEKALRYDYPLSRIIRTHKQGIEDYAFDADQYQLLARDTRQHDKISENISPVTDFTWGMGDLITRLSESGFRVVSLVEIDYSWEERYWNWLSVPKAGICGQAVGSVVIPATFILVAVSDPSGCSL